MEPETKTSPKMKVVEWIDASIAPDRLKIMELTRRHVRRMLRNICLDKDSFNYGGFVNDSTNYADSRNSIFEAQTLFAAYAMPCFPEFHGNPELLKRIMAHLEFMRRRQHGDGSVNLGVCGGGGSEVGFTLPGCCESYRRVLQCDLPGRTEILETFENYIRRGAKCVRENFSGTSNHRWTAFTGPLAVVGGIFPDPANSAFIQEYLSDGIDMDDFGMYYEERSPNYDCVANWGLLMLSDHFGRKDFLDLIERNLNFTLAMRQPCGEAESLFSHRQDRGAAGRKNDQYYIFKRLAIEKRNGIFATAADMILDSYLSRADGELPNQFIPLVCLDENFGLSDEHLERKPLPETCDIKFKKIPIWRRCDGKVASTVVADAGGHFWDATDSGLWGCSKRSASFLDFHCGEAVIDAVRINWGTGSGCFRPEAIEYSGENSATLSYVDPGAVHLSHFRPEGKRFRRVAPHDQNASVCIRAAEDGSLSISVKVGGWRDMPINFQLLLRESCSLLHSDGRRTPLEKGGTTFSSGGGYVLEGRDGSVIGINGLPKSLTYLRIGDGQSITGIAEERCHRLIVSIFTPVDFKFSLVPDSKGQI